MQPQNHVRSQRVDLTGGNLRPVLLELLPALNEFFKFNKNSREVLGKIIIESDPKKLCRFNTRICSQTLNVMRWLATKYGGVLRAEGGKQSAVEKHKRREQTQLAERSVMTSEGHCG